MSRDPDLQPRHRLRDRLTAARRAVLRRRRLLAVLCTAGAVLAGLRATAPPAPATADVWVAARDLPAGAALEEDDVTIAALPPDAVPDGVVAEPVGALLAAPLRTGEPVTDVRLVGPDLVDAAPGTIALPVRLSDAGHAGLLTVGDVVDVIATDPESRTTTTVSEDAVVQAVPAADEGAGGAIPGRLVVLGVSSDTVSPLTGAAVTSFVTYAWQSR
jgi:Flp pilus assembly protein CpaB